MKPIIFDESIIVLTFDYKNSIVRIVALSSENVNSDDSLHLNPKIVVRYSCRTLCLDIQKMVETRKINIVISK